MYLRSRYSQAPRPHRRAPLMTMPSSKAKVSTVPMVVPLHTSVTIWPMKCGGLTGRRDTLGTRRRLAASHWTRRLRFSWHSCLTCKAGYLNMLCSASSRGPACGLSSSTASRARGLLKPLLSVFLLARPGHDCWRAAAPPATWTPSWHERLCACQLFLAGRHMPS